MVKQDLSYLLKEIKRQISKNPIKLNEISLNMPEIQKRSGINKEHLAGCYVLVSNLKPFYVGISRNVINRLRQHIKGKTHFDASLAFRMAKANRGLEKGVTRNKAMKIPAFERAFNQAKEYLQEANVVCVAIDSPEVRYLFEIYAAMEFNTSRWNSFDTH